MPPVKSLVPTTVLVLLRLLAVTFGIQLQVSVVNRFLVQTASLTAV